MKYLNELDLRARIQTRLKDESQADNFSEDDLEAQNIELIKSMIGSRYDVATIFNEDSPLVNGLLTRILTNLVIYDLVRRNAARKVPSDYKDNYDEAMKLLQKINSGALLLDGLPSAKDNEGNTLSDTIWANNRNEDNFL